METTRAGKHLMNLAVLAKNAINSVPPKKRMSYYKDFIEEMKSQLTKIRIRDMERSEVEKILKKAGWKDLRWLPHSIDSYKKNIKWELCGTPPDYKGPYEGWIEAVVYDIVDKHHINHVRYAWKSHYRNKKKY
jgi:hypothetical protein